MNYGKVYSLLRPITLFTFLPVYEVRDEKGKLLMVAMTKLTLANKLGVENVNGKELFEIYQNFFGNKAEIKDEKGKLNYVIEQSLLNRKRIVRDRKGGVVFDIEGPIRNSKFTREGKILGELKVKGLVFEKIYLEIKNSSLKEEILLATILLAHKIHDINHSSV